MNETRAQWLTTSQASAALGVSERTIQRRAAKGKITARKVTDGDGEKWEILLGADMVTPESADSGARGDDNTNERHSVPVAPEIGESGATLPTSAAIGDDTSETAFLRAQLEAINAALEREQSAHEQTRQLLAGALQMASRQLPNATPQSTIEAQDRAQSAKVDRDSATDARGDKRGANRQGYGSLLKRLRNNIKEIIR